MFIPRTPGGILAEELRKNEEIISNQSGYKIKLVERSGTKITDLLVKSDPFKIGQCQCPNCPPCKYPQEKSKAKCWVKNIV